MKKRNPLFYKGETNLSNLQPQELSVILKL